MSKHILMIVTSHSQINATRKTGLWFEEFAEPYRAFRQKGYDITVASPKGGAVPIDPNSLPENPDAALMAVIADTVRLQNVNLADYDAVFLPGGHGTMFDLPDAQVGRAIGAFADAGKVIGAVCHGPAGLVGARRADGTPVVQGYRLTSFTNEEEAAAHLVEGDAFPAANAPERAGCRVYPCSHLERSCGGGSQSGDRAESAVQPKHCRSRNPACGTGRRKRLTSSAAV